MYDVPFIRHTIWDAKQLQERTEEQCVGSKIVIICDCRYS